MLVVTLATRNVFKATDHKDGGAHSLSSAAAFDVARVCAKLKWKQSFYLFCFRFVLVKT